MYIDRDIPNHAPTPTTYISMSEDMLRQCDAGCFLTWSPLTGSEPTLGLLLAPTDRQVQGGNGQFTNHLRLAQASEL